MVGKAAAILQQGGEHQGDCYHSVAQIFIQPPFTECLFCTRHCTDAGNFYVHMYKINQIPVYRELTF